MRIRLVVVSLALIATFGLLVPSAEASVNRTYFIDDPRDVAIPKGDVLRFRLTHGPSNVVLQLDLRRASDLAADDGWSKYASSNVFVPLDTRGTAAVDFHVDVHTSSSGVIAEVYEEGAGFDTWRGYADISQNAAHTTIRITIPRSFLANPAELRARAAFAWDWNEDGTIDSRDRIPDVGFTPQVTHA